MIKKLLLAVLLVPIMAMAWEPTKPVTVIVGNTPGAGNEIAFRKLAAIVQKTNPTVVFVVQNIPGADSVIANNRVLEAVPDGYTINLPSHMSSYVTNDIWEKSIKKYKYDSFVDVLTMGKSPLVLVASVRSDINTPEQFVRLIRTTTAPISVAVGGGAHRTAFEYLMDRGKGNRDQVKAIKFNGPMPAVTSVASYDGTQGTEFGILPIAVAKALIDAGKVKPIGFTGTRRMPQFPAVVSWYQREFSAAVRSAEYKEWADGQVVFYEESELTPAGLKRQMDELRAAFIPVLSRIDLNKE